MAPVDSKQRSGPRAGRLILAAMWASTLAGCNLAPRYAPPVVTVATAAFCYFTKRNPLWALGAAAALGLTGLVS